MIYNVICEISNDITSILWKVPNFYQAVVSGSLIKINIDKLNRIGAWTNKRLYLEFQLRIVSAQSNDLIEIMYKSPSTIHLKFTCSLYCDNTGERKISTDENSEVQANCWKRLCVLSRCEIESYPSNFLESSNLCLKFQLTFTNNPNDNSDAELHNEFENMLNNSLFSDVIMKSADDIEFKVHKAVLASRSAVLRAHFEHNTTECLTNIVLSPLESDVLREVLTFIYSEKAPRVNEIPEKLLAAADYYQLSRLKTLCEEAIHINVENAIEILQLADLHSANIVKKKTLKFIKDGRLRLVTKTEGWDQLQSVKLVKSICEYIADNIK